MGRNQVDDRRKFIRFPVQLNARYSEENKEEWHECFIVNISREGMGIIVYSRKKIPFDSVLQLEIVVPIKKDSIRITGTLIWIKGLKGNPKFNFVGGVKIITIDSEDKWTLLDYAYEGWDWGEG